MTRAGQWAAFARGVAACVAIALITVAATLETLRIGPAAAGLLYLLPVLWVAAQAGLASGLANAAFAAFCYNYFLLEPRFTLRIHGVNDVAAFLVLTVVAVVTSRLASDLRTRERSAQAQAAASAAEADFAAVLARPHRVEELDRAALAFLSQRYGEAMLVRSDDLAAKRTRLSPIDAAAAAWALHNGGLSGRGSEVMPAADLRFVPLARAGDDVLALAAVDTNDVDDRQEVLALGRLWTQARDRLIADAERQARHEADQREAVRRTLLAALGHDFRTPLTVLKSGLATLDGEPAARLGREVDRIARLSEDLIATARLEAGLPARLEPIDLVDAVAAAIPASTGSAAAISVTIPDELPLVRADAVMIVHLLGNLVDNALRHATTAVAIAARAVDHDVDVDVVDDGAGVDPAVAGAIFERFVSGSDRDGGSGLGLSIARDLAHAMGATLTAIDRPAGGACFRLRIAAVPQAEPVGR